ncbi:MAG: hypothetical protein FK733_08195 [Asgard group archaeon]|nr:hypothetical protein [Asgard group archaeon]
MKRIVIIGNSAAGKSHLAVELSKEFSIPLYHLDKILWKPNWVRTPEDEFIEKHNAIVKKESWIIDGVAYKSTYDLRFDKADVIIFLDISPEICFKNAKKRMQEDLVRPNPFVNENCPYPLELIDKQLEVINSFHNEYRSLIFEKLSMFSETKNIIILGDDFNLEELVDLLNALKKKEK